MRERERERERERNCSLHPPLLPPKRSRYFQCQTRSLPFCIDGTNVGNSMQNSSEVENVKVADKLYLPKPIGYSNDRLTPLVNLFYSSKSQQANFFFLVEKLKISFDCNSTVVCS